VTRELCDLSAVDMLAGFRAKTFSPLEVMTSVHDRIARREPVVKALWSPQPERAVELARQSTERWANGTPCGPLDGVPYTLKDNIATQGTPVPLGSAATELIAASVDSPPAARAREAGGILLGKTTMPDLGMLSSGLSSFHQLTSNPWNPAWNPGGSSAGGGAAAAAGYGPLHVGTDIGGSLRLPASWNAIVSLKPSNGRIAINPPFFGRVAGPMSRTVADNALFMSVLGQFDPADFMALPPARVDWMHLDGFDPRGIRIALHLDAGAGMAVEPETRALIERAASLFRDAGATVVELPAFFSQTALDDLDLFWRVRGWVDYIAMAPERRERLLPFIREWVHGGKDVSGETLMRCVNRKLEVRKLTQLATEPFDLVLSPVSPVPTFPVDWPMPSNSVSQAMAHIAFTVPYNMSEQPALSINAGFTAAGKAVGLQISGRRFADRDVLQAANWFEAHRPSDAQPDWTIPSVGATF